MQMEAMFGGVCAFMLVWTNRLKEINGKYLHEKKHLWSKKVIYIGDSKKIMSNDEKWGGSPRNSWSFKKFRGCIRSNELIDLRDDGLPWTWISTRDK